tara:strand:- start:230133 stop:230246 length:114 start_codon:yes stop_codon:yes gene_type:complete
MNHIPEILVLQTFLARLQNTIFFATHEVKTELIKSLK